MHVWIDRWVTTSHEGKVLSPCPFSDTDIKVYAILDPTTHGWREDILREVLPFDVEKIRNVPVTTARGATNAFGQKVVTGF